MRPNKAGREIWFDRVGWSYLPCAWKGVFAIVLVVVPTCLLVFLMLSLLGTDIHPDRTPFAFIPLPIGVLLGLWLTERHSPDRD